MTRPTLAKLLVLLAVVAALGLAARLRAAATAEEPGAPQAVMGEESAVEVPALAAPAGAAPAPLPVKKGGREKRVILAWEDERAIDGILADLSTHLQTPIKLSNVLRSVVILLRHSEEGIRNHARRATYFVRPPNNDATAIAVFEHRLARLLQAGFKESAYLE